MTSKKKLRARGRRDVPGSGPNFDKAHGIKSTSPQPRKNSKRPSVPAPLMDMVFNFVREHGYVRAGHHIRVESQKREQTGGYTKPCSWTKASDKYPKLVEMFDEWQERHPEIKWLPQGEHEAKKAKTNPNNGQGAQENVEDISSSDSEDTSDSDSASEESDIEMGGFAEAAKSANLIPENIPLPDSSAESSDSASDSASDSTSGSSSSSSDSESEEESNVTGAISGSKAPAPAVVSKVTLKSISESKSDSDSDSDSSDQDVVPLVTPRKRKASKSSSDVSSSSASDSSDSSSESDSDSDAPHLAKKARLADSPRSQPTTASSRTAQNLTPATSASAVEEDGGDEEEAEEAGGSIAINAGAAAPKDPSTLSESSATLARTSPDDRPERPPTGAVAGAAAAATTGRFRRVPVDQRVDERFAAAGFAGGEYAERALQDLAPTKGRKFTREKGKKKRGSYRGGAIDAFGVNSIRFED